MNQPHVLVNVAMTVDGKIDSVLRQGATISSAQDAARVDNLRAEVDAVLVGGRTLLGGDPGLTIKSPDLRAHRLALGRPENPAKVAVVSEAEVKPDSRFMTAGSARRLIYTTSRTSPKQVTRLQEAGAEVFVLGQARVDLPAMLGSLYNLGMRTLLVEGGGTLISEFFRLDLVDELTIYIAPRIFAGTTAPSLADGQGFRPNASEQSDQPPHLWLLSVERYDPEDGVLLHYQVVHANST